MLILKILSMFRLLIDQRINNRVIKTDFKTFYYI